MKSIRFIYLLLLLFALAAVLTGCDSRDGPEDYSVREVKIKLEWAGVTEKLPEGMRVIFYPKTEEGRKVDTYMSPAGGEISVSPGRYSMVIYNFDTECIKVQGEGSYETIEAVAIPYSGTDTDEKMNWSPDPLYVVALDDIEIEESDVPLQLELKPENAVRRYSFEIKVEGLAYVANVICSVKGLDGSYFMGLNSSRTSNLPIYVEMQKGDGVLKGAFSSFMMTKRDYSVPVVTRADAEVMMTLKLVKIDNTVQEVKVDITQVVAPPSQGGSTEEPEQPGEDVKIDIPLEEDIVVEEVIPTPGGGIGGEVGGWGDETNVQL